MVAGHLQEKKGMYYVVLSYYDEVGKRHTKWRSTGLPVKGNKKRAEEMMIEIRREFEPDVGGVVSKENMLFADYMEYWLEIVKSSISIVTYSSYCAMVKGIIAPYFRERRIRLAELTPSDIQDFYTEQLKRVKPNSVIHYHANIHKALKYAVKTDLIPSSPADKVERPKKNTFVGGFYDADEINRLFEVVKGTKLELAVLFGAFYGLRRSEVVGLKWDAIDFKQNTIAIRHTVVSCSVDGKKVIVADDSTKNTSSKRTLPLVPQFRDRLLALQREQEQNRLLCGRSYSRKYEEYIYVNEMGERICPNYITSNFPLLLARNGLRKIRFHDLRHSCASLLLANGVPMKAIQEWMGHSDFSTTANIYAHLDFQSKVSSADALIGGLQMAIT